MQFTSANNAQLFTINIHNAHNLIYKQILISIVNLSNLCTFIENQSFILFNQQIIAYLLKAQPTVHLLSIFISSYKRYKQLILFIL